MVIRVIRVMSTRFLIHIPLMRSSIRRGIRIMRVIRVITTELRQVAALQGY